MAEQLIKKTEEGHSNVMPKSWIEAITDKSTGESLTHILQGFNMYFLSYTGNTEQTRCQVPKILRKKGLWVTYVKYDGNVYTEWYNSNDIDDKSWGNSSNWRIGNNELVGDLTISANGNWVINGNETEFKAIGEKGNTPLIRIANNKLQVSYDTGNTYHNVSDNPVYTQIRTYNNKLQISTDLGANWTDASDEIAAYFRFNSGQGNNVGSIQISRNNKDWNDLSGNFVNNLHISKYIGADETLPTSGIAEGTIYAKGPTYADSDTSHSNPIYRLWVYAYKGSTLAWQDNGEFTSISAGVVQELGTSQNQVISQKCVSQEIIQGGVYDVSFHNNNAVFESLQALLSSPSLSTFIPALVRHGGMSIKFIQGSVPSSDNKYVQYRLMSPAWSNTESDWQGVDDNPTNGSKNLVTSGGVEKKYQHLEREINGDASYYIELDFSFGKQYNIVGTSPNYKLSNVNDSNGYYTPLIDISMYRGAKIVITSSIRASGSSRKTLLVESDKESVVFFRSEEEYIEGEDGKYRLSIDNVPNNTTYLCMSFNGQREVTATAIVEGIGLVDIVQEHEKEISDIQETLDGSNITASPVFETGYYWSYTNENGLKKLLKIQNASSVYTEKINVSEYNGCYITIVSSTRVSNSSRGTIFTDENDFLPTDYNIIAGYSYFKEADYIEDENGKYKLTTVIPQGSKYLYLSYNGSRQVFYSITDTNSGIESKITNIENNIHRLDKATNNNVLPIIVFVYDDSVEEDEDMVALYNKYGVKLTFSAIKENNGWSEKMKLWQKDGHGTVAHGVRGSSDGIDTMTDNQVVSWFNEELNWMIANGFQHDYIMYFNSMKINPHTLSLVKSFFKGAICESNYGVVKWQTSRYAMNRCNIDNGGTTTDPTTKYNNAITSINDVLGTSNMVILGGHSFRVIGDPAFVEMHENLLSYVKKLIDAGLLISMNAEDAFKTIEMRNTGVTSANICNAYPNIERSLNYIVDVGEKSIINNQEVMCTSSGAAAVYKIIISGTSMNGSFVLEVDGFTVTATGYDRQELEIQTSISDKPKDVVKKICQQIYTAYTVAALSDTEIILVANSNRVANAPSITSNTSGLSFTIDTIRNGSDIVWK